MKLNSKAYKRTEQGLLQQIGKGYCIGSLPIPKKGSKLDPYVSLDFGSVKIHIDKNDFLRFCKHALEFSMYNRKEIEGK